jgi:hypothetical protein
MNAMNAIKFEKQRDVAGMYWFDGPRGKSCMVCRQGDKWMARGESWYGQVVRYGKTRNEAAEKLVSELES